jgi:transposase
MKAKERRYYADEFKTKAVELANLRGNTTQVARELDLRPGLLQKWVSRHRLQHMDSSDTSKPNLAGVNGDQFQIKQLKQELEFVRMERDILKKAVSIFSKNEDVRTR